MRGPGGTSISQISPRSTPSSDIKKYGSNESWSRTIKVVRVGITRRLADINRLGSLPWAATDFHRKSVDSRQLVFSSEKTSRLAPARSILTRPNK